VRCIRLNKFFLLSEQLNTGSAAGRAYFFMCFLQSSKTTNLWVTGGAGERAGEKGKLLVFS
jgi:hypothetical protein